jgi:hypothetical protein
MANLTRALVIEPTFAEAEKLHDSIDGADSKPAEMIRGMLFAMLRNASNADADAEASAPISITVTFREATG